jgi:hypothetical protein
MTTDTDKLVRIAAAAGASLDDSLGYYRFSEAALSAFASAHIASLCGDVEPVAWSVTCDGEHVNNVHTSEIEANRAKRNLDRDFPDHSREVVPLAPASTVAALKAERDAALARVAELEKDAARYRLLRRGQKWSVVDGIGTVLRADELDAAIDAALTKGQLAPQPQQ